MAASTLTSKGQITIPKEVLRPESRDPLEGLVGLLRHRAKEQPATVEEMNEAVRARAAEKHARRPSMLIRRERQISRIS